MVGYTLRWFTYIQSPIQVITGLGVEQLRVNHYAMLTPHQLLVLWLVCLFVIITLTRVDKS